MFRMFNGRKEPQREVVVLVKKTYEQTRATNSVERLEFVSAIKGTSPSRDQAENFLRREALANKAHYVFGVKYEGPEDSVTCSGDIYKLPSK